MPQDMMAEVETRVLAKLQDDAPNGVQEVVDPAVWVGLFSSLVELITECVKKRNQAPETVASALETPTRAQRLALRHRMVKAVGRRQYRKHGDAINEKLSQVGAEATQAERVAFVQEALTAR